MIGSTIVVIGQAVFPHQGGIGIGLDMGQAFGDLDQRATLVGHTGVAAVGISKLD